MKKIFLFILLIPSFSFAQKTKAQLDAEADSIKNETIARNNNSTRLTRMWKNQNASFLNPTNGDILAKVNGGTGTSSPSLVAGTNVTITGSWPNQTINSSGGGGISGLTTGVMPYATSSSTIGDSEITRTSNGVYTISSSNATTLNLTSNGTGYIKKYLNSYSTPNLFEIGNNSVNVPTQLWGTGGVLISNWPSSTQNVPSDANQYPLNINFTGTDGVVSQALRLRNGSASSTSVGFGVGIQFETQATSTYRVGNTIESISTNVSGSPSFDLVFKGMTSGASSEKFRLTSYGALLTGSTAYSTVALGSIGSSQNDYAIGNGTVFYVTPTAGINITGIANTIDGRIIYITNLSGSFGIGFPDNSGSSSSGNRFSIPGGFTLAAGNTCQFVYVSGFWRLSAKTN